MNPRSLLVGFCLCTASLASAQPQEGAPEKVLRAHLVGSEPVVQVQKVVRIAAESERGMIGVRLAEAEGGVSIAGVMPGSPALEAGLRAGDLIVAVGKTKVATAGELLKAMEGKQAGDRVKLQIDRDGWRKKVQLELAPAARFQGEAHEGHEALGEEAELEQLIEEYFEGEQLSEQPILEDAEIRIVRLGDHDEEDLEELHHELMELGVDLEGLHGKLAHGGGASCGEAADCGKECKDSKSCDSNAKSCDSGVSCEVEVIELKGGTPKGGHFFSGLVDSKESCAGDAKAACGQKCKTDCEPQSCHPEKSASHQRVEVRKQRAGQCVPPKLVKAKAKAKACGAGGCATKECGSCGSKAKPHAKKQGRRWVQARHDQADAGWHHYMASKGHNVQLKASACGSADCKPADCKPGACDSANCKPADCKPGACDSANCKPADCKPGACDSANCKPANCKPGACGSADCKPADCKPGACGPADCKPADCKPGACDSADCKPADCKPGACGVATKAPKEARKIFLSARERSVMQGMPEHGEAFRALRHEVAEMRREMRALKAELRKLKSRR